jgi:hypothetical protein
LALQGTLDTFALPDVLRLLASTKKTGRLLVTGSRGTGSVWVGDGGVVGAEATGTTADAGSVETLFELLRYPDGGFTFEAGVEPVAPTTSAAVEPLLHDAEQLLAEWREIEAVVPSMDAWVTLVSEIDGDEILIAADWWKAIVAVGSGASVTSVGHSLKLGELDVCRQVKQLVERSLVRISTTPMPTLTTLETSAWTANGSTNGSTNGTSERSAATWDPFAVEIPPLDPIAPADDRAVAEADDDAAEVDIVAVDEQVEPVTSLADYSSYTEAPRVDDEPEVDADEVAKQLASLSPRAAQAVAAAAQASTDEEREAALAQADDDDEPINRGLLLKFLSSVKS